MAARNDDTRGDLREGSNGDDGRAAHPAAERLSGFGTSIFTEMTRLAIEHGAVNLGQGFPDFPAPEFIKQAAAAAIVADHNQYAPATGLPRLREAIARKFQQRHGVLVDPEAEVTVTSGATEAIFDTIVALVNPGDEVVVFEPFYDSYLPAIQMAGGVPRVVTLRPPRWDFSPGELVRAFSARTKLVILNTPHNPTGKVFSKVELDIIAAAAVQHDAIVLSDEVYSEITYGNAQHVPMASRPGMFERTITVDSLGKTFSVTGWKIGWAIAPPLLSRALRAVHQFVTFCSGTPMQVAAVNALAFAEQHDVYAQLRAAYAERRARLEGILTEAGLPVLPIAGAYFLLADFSGLPFADDVAFCRYLTKDVGVAAIPPSAFYADPRNAPRLVRFCFAKRESTLDAAAARLASLRLGTR
ncbi:MAG TPA: methionine aminotransferase [Polyangia bacterium]